MTDLAQLTLEKRKKIAGLNPARADIIVSGLVIIERIMSHLHVNVVQVHTRGVRDGLLLGDGASRVRRSAGSVSSEAKRAPPRSSSSPRAAASICRTPGRSPRSPARFGSNSPRRSTCGPHDRELIEAAALLANVGYLINFEGHHKHSYHLILNSELPGFEREQLRLLALVARYHRGSRPKKKHDDYPRSGR